MKLACTADEPVPMRGFGMALGLTAALMVAVTLLTQLVSAVPAAKSATDAALASPPLVVDEHLRALLAAHCAIAGGFACFTADPSPPTVAAVP